MAGIGSIVVDIRSGDLLEPHLTEIIQAINRLQQAESSAGSDLPLTTLAVVTAGAALRSTRTFTRRRLFGLCD